MKSYIGVVHKDPASCFGVSFPDFPGCIGAGDTLEQALVDAGEALSFHIQGMREDGMSIPEPSGIEILKTDPEYASGVAFIVTPPARPKGRAVRTNISMDEYLLADVDAYAASHGLTRSAFLADAARRVMASAS